MITAVEIGKILVFVGVFSTVVAVGCYVRYVRYVGWLRFDNSRDCTSKEFTQSKA